MYLSHFKPFLAAAVLVPALCLNAKLSAAPQEHPAVSNLTAQAFSGTVQANYTLFLPQGYDANGTNRWPLILFLHGIGESGTNVWKTAVHGPVQYIRKHPEFPFILASPQCPASHKWSDEIVLGVLDEVIAKHAVNTNRVYLTGLSMGGYGSWSLLTAHPERFAAAAPISGGGDTMGIIVSQFDGRKMKALKTLPVWAFHGGRDDIVPVAESQRMVDALKKFGNPDVSLTIYPEAGHNAWTQTYDNPELYQWFLSHTRMPVK